MTRAKAASVLSNARNHEDRLQRGVSVIRSLLINLDSAAARRAHMHAEFGKLGIAYERICAVDGSAPNVKGLAAQSAFSAREIGNFLSHQKVWDLIASRKDKYCAVFEDDIFLAPALAGFLSDDRWIPVDADIIKIETMLMAVNIDRQVIYVAPGFGLRRLRSTHWGVAGYIMSAKAAQTLSAWKLAAERPADHVLFDFNEKQPSGFAVYQLDPALCIQHDVITEGLLRGSLLDSTIQPERNAMTPRPKRKTPLSRIASELGKLTQMIVRASNGRVVRMKIPFAGID
jgi:glycosyl transferase family 25